MTTNNISHDDRNADLGPEILQALDANKAGNFNERNSILFGINSKLVERGDNVSDFWTSFQECMNITKGDKPSDLAILVLALGLYYGNA